MRLNGRCVLSVVLTIVATGCEPPRQLPLMRCRPVSTAIEGALPWFRVERVVTTEDEYRESFEALDEAVNGRRQDLPVVMNPEPGLEARMGIPKGPLQVGGWQYDATSTELRAFVADRSYLDVTGPDVTEAQALEKVRALASQLPWVGPDEDWHFEVVQSVVSSSLAPDRAVGGDFFSVGWRRVRGLDVEQTWGLGMMLLSNGQPVRITIPLHVVRAVGSPGAEQPCDAVGSTTPLDEATLQTRFERDVLKQFPGSRTKTGGFRYRARRDGQLFEPVFSAPWLPRVAGSLIALGWFQWTVRADGAGTPTQD